MSIDSTSLLEQIMSLIDATNLRIKKHNALVSNIKEEKLKLTGLIWKFFTEKGKPYIQQYLKTESALNKGIDGLNKQLKYKRKMYKDLKNEIQQLNKTETSVQSSVDEINRTHKRCGFNNFSIEPSNEVENYYQIRRYFQ